ncbi:MAG: helix-turn-helix transcriptional regulator [Chloroflexi bacterium]|nr:helix-turn-helix transcriptional regulator [Chloroflexota bacterium]
MITNERQYWITKNKAKRFVDALEDFDAMAVERTEVDPRLVVAEREAMEAQLGELRGEVEEYERLREAGVSAVVVRSIDELPEGLIKARIASRLTQRELADRLHLKAQQIQRYEAERYASASYERLCAVAHALGVGGPTGFFTYGEGHGEDRRLDEAGEAGEESAFEASGGARGMHAK